MLAYLQDGSFVNLGGAIMNEAGNQEAEEQTMIEAHIFPGTRELWQSQTVMGLILSTAWRTCSIDRDGVGQFGCGISYV